MSEQKFRAKENISFGHQKDSKGKDRPQVSAGDVFVLDDPEVAKKLLADGKISEDLKPTDAERAAGSGAATFTDPSKPPANVTRNAAEMSGDAADEVNKRARGEHLKK